MGVAINVVNKDMISSTTNIWAERMPISNPMFSATSCISPRVFISVPTIRLSFQFSPTARAASVHPPNFPAMATTINSRHTPHNSGVFINPISVCSPEKAKNRGRKNTREISSTFSIMTLRNPRFMGITTPAMNAPKRAWIPIISVATDESTRNRKMNPTNALLITSELAYVSPILRRNGRMTINMNAM